MQQTTGPAIAKSVSGNGLTRSYTALFLLENQEPNSSAVSKAPPISGNTD